ncbi:hypothetical protein BP6252_11345 [Coleophoma cylindrospora]|uniref:Uncharacterized protein n=1 Tax=Coleophoma cylindrospora TaxID=1849047 RepID=A0A3D8QQ80_9HELO|nr:hypothetical protein BP6252_11345 [Coleophoma cylindrospora]
MEPTTTINERGSLHIINGNAIPTNGSIPLEQAVLQLKFHNETVNELQPVNGFAKDHIQATTEPEDIHSHNENVHELQLVNGFAKDHIQATAESGDIYYKVEEPKIEIIPEPQPDTHSTHSQDKPTQRDVSENGLTNGHGTSTLVSKLEAIDGASNLTATTSSLTNTFTPLAPFVPASTRLRQIIAHSPNILVCPGVYDGLSARIADAVGFKGIYMTGAGTTASCLGAADLGIAQLHDMRTNANMIANLRPGGSGPPLIADMDTGYGGPLIIARAVQAYVLAGVAGFHIEDQIAEKRCGHLQGKEVVDIETYIQRIKACVLSRARLRSDIVIIARTDANQSRGYAECITRLKRARDEGADMGILEGFVSKEQARQAVQDMAPWPLCLNSVENGVSPLISVAEAEEMGFKVMIFSFAALAPAYVAIKETFERLLNHGVTGTPKEITPKTIFQVCGLDEEAEIDAATGGKAFSKGV